MLTAGDYSSSGEYAIVRDVQTDLKIPLSNLCEYEMSKRQEKARDHSYHGRCSITRGVRPLTSISEPPSCPPAVGKYAKSDL